MLGIAVLGCGRIGKMHARNLARHPQARLISVFDPVAAVASATAQGLGVRAASSVEAVLQDRSVNAVLIASPTDTHVALITAAAQAGKAILCEKPIDLDLARAERCWTEIAPLKPSVMIGFNRRFDPSFQTLHERMQRGEIGSLEQLLITSRDPAPPSLEYAKASGGLWRDMAIHDFDMARYLAGDIVEVYALGANLVDPAIGAIGDIDTGMLTLRSKSGALVHINNSRRCVYGYDQRVEAFGSKGMLLAGNQRPTTVELWGSECTQSRDVVLPFFIERYAEAYAAEVSHFVGCVQESRPLSPSFADGIAALKLADAAARSTQTGQTVRL